MKSLGVFTYPSVSVEQFSGGSGEVIIRIEDRTRYVKIKMTIYCVKRIINLTHLILEKYKKYIEHEKQNYGDLVEHNRYKEK